MDREGNALMIARGFKSVIWAATVGSAALGCYMVSLRVATERNELAKVERQIIEARRDIRSLQTELGTRGRMTQLEQWNAEVLALSAPSSQQFLKDEFTLARLYRNDPTVAERSAEVRLASAEAPAAKPSEPAKPQAPAVVQAVAERPAAAAPLIHRASFDPGEPVARPAIARASKPAAQRLSATTTAEIAASAKPAVKPAKPGAVVARSEAKPAKPEATPTRTAAKPAKLGPAATRTAAKPAKAEAGAMRTAAKPTKPEATATRTAAKPTTAAAKPVREAAAAPRQAKVKGSGGN
jgi:hypothetical protein